MSAREIVLKWMPQNTVDDKPSTVQLIACYRQASHHYMSQCRPAIYMLPYTASLDHAEYERHLVSSRHKFVNAFENV